MSSSKMAMAMMVAVALLSSTAVAQPDTTNCDNNGAYDITTGKATCNGSVVDFFELLCGPGFTQQGCVAKWKNSNNEEEEYFFMGAGAGIDATQLPPACSSNFKDTGLAAVQYKPGGATAECYPAADIQGSTATYSSDSDGKLASVTINFAEHDDGTSVRAAYVRVTCASARGGWTTTGDSKESSKYELDVTAPCNPTGAGDKGKSGGGMDDGGIIILIVFCLGASYFLFGFVFMWKVKKQEGSDRIPNKEFWFGLGGLIKEGFRFTKAKITRSEYAPL